MMHAQFAQCSDTPATDNHGLTLFDCWVRRPDGSECVRVWAESADAAYAFLLPYGGRGLIDVEIAR